MSNACFEDRAELVEFFNSYKTEMIEKYKEKTKKGVKGPFMAQSLAYFVARDCLENHNIMATDCQIYRMASLIVMEDEEIG